MLFINYSFIIRKLYASIVFVITFNKIIVKYALKLSQYEMCANGLKK